MVFFSLSIVRLLFVFFSSLSVANCVSVIANVRGAKFNVKTDTVENLIVQLRDLVPSFKSDVQHSILFKGKVLEHDANLVDFGVNEGDTLTILKGQKRKVRKSPSSFKVPTKALQQLDGLSILDNKIDPEQMKQAVDSMETMLNSNVLEEYFADESKLELIRLQLLENLDSYEKMIPGFKAQAQDIVNNPAKWRDAMVNAKDHVAAIKGKMLPPPSSSFDTKSVDDIDEETEETKRKKMRKE